MTPSSKEVPKGIEARKLKRRHLIYYLEVYNDATDELLGHLVDITVKGIKLVSKEKIELKKQFRLRMHMPEEYFKEKTIRFVAKGMWCRPDVNPDFFATGFSTPELEQNTRTLFARLINQVGFND